MTDRNDGGTAFPTLETETCHPQFGMSLRDYFAAQALRDFMGAIAAGGWLSHNETQYAAYAKMAYRAADALLAERDKSPTLQAMFEAPGSGGK